MTAGGKTPAPAPDAKARLATAMPATTMPATTLPAPTLAADAGRHDGLLLAAAAFALYAALAPGVSGDGDGSEFTLVLATAGVPHPTGYPLYLLGGHAFVRALHACGVGWARASNLWSAVGATLALYLMHALTRRLLAPAPFPAGAAGRAAAGRPAGRRGSGPPTSGAAARRALALVPPVLLLLNPIWTNEATLAEVYSWHAAWVMGLSLLFARFFLDAPEQAGPRQGAAWGLLVGAGLAHHLTAVFVAAPLTLVLLFQKGLPTPRRAGLWAAALAGVLVPLSAYGFIGWRATHPAAWQWPLLEPGWRGLYEHATGALYRHLLGFFAPSAPHLVLLTWAGWPLLALGLPALALAARAAGPGRRRVALGTLAAAATLASAQAFSYGVPDPAPYFLPGILLALVGLAVAAGPLLAAQPAGGAPRGLLGLVAAALVVAALVGWTRMTLRRRHDVVTFDPLIREMWQAVPDTTAIVFWGDDDYLRLREYQILGREKLSVDVENAQVLMNEPVRRRYLAATGIDPLRGLSTPVLRPGAAGNDEVINRFVLAVIQNVNRQTPRKVILFDPGHLRVLVINKPDSTAAWPPASR